MWQTIKRLREERGQFLAEMKTILKTAEDSKRELTEQENTHFDELNTKAEQRKSDIERYETAQRLETELLAANNGNGTQTRQQPGRDNLNTPEKRAEAEQQEQRAQIDTFLRNGRIAPPETRALSVSGAGIVGDRIMYNSLITAMKSYAGVRQAGATVLPTSDGNDFPVPMADDTNNEGQIVGENVTDDTEEDPDLGNVALKAYKFDSKWIKVSLELLQDAAYPVESFILGIGAERIGRSFNGYATTGTGSGQPKGFLVAGTAGLTAAANNAFTYEEMLDFIHSIDAAYRNQPNFRLQFHDKTLAAIRKLKDGDGRYIFTSGNGGAPATVLDFPYVVNNKMPQLTDGAGSKVVAAGDWSRYFVRDVTGVVIIRATELFAGSGQVGFRIFARHDGNLTDLNAVKYLKLAAA